MQLVHQRKDFPRGQPTHQTTFNVMLLPQSYSTVLTPHSCRAPFIYVMPHLSIRALTRLEVLDANTCSHDVNSPGTSPTELIILLHFATRWKSLTCVILCHPEHMIIARMTHRLSRSQPLWTWSRKEIKYCSQTVRSSEHVDQRFPALSLYGIRWQMFCSSILAIHGCRGHARANDCSTYSTSRQPVTNQEPSDILRLVVVQPTTDYRGHLLGISLYDDSKVNPQ